MVLVLLVGDFFIPFRSIEVPKKFKKLLVNLRKGKRAA
jgi:hypothetical protein